MDESQADNKLGARLYTDVQVSLYPAMFESKVGLTLGVNNLFDKDPLACFSCGLNNFAPPPMTRPASSAMSA
ncbi:MAG: hypothetical protein ACOVN0_06640 [Niveispirillum sp.]|uniref:hypothetical protein n=1 Tax=Niveispirillum sp. TaxID=1917217 RepID=UPI003BA82A08